MAAKKRKRSGGRKRTKRARGQKAVLHLSTLIILLWLAERMGVLDGLFWTYLKSGDISGCVTLIKQAVANNFSGHGVATTVAGGVSVAVVVGLLRVIAKGSTISLKKPKAIAV